MRRSPSGETTEGPAPEGASHWLPVTDGLVMTGNEDHRLYLLRVVCPPRPLTPERTGEQDDIYTEFVAGPDRREIWCVREPQHDSMAARQIVAVSPDGSCAVRSLLRTTRCVTTPHPSPDGTFGWPDPAQVLTSQATLLRDALRRNRVPHACLIFVGEGHILRRAKTIGRALEAELSFYGQALGLEPSESSRLAMDDGSVSIGRTK